MKRFDLSVKIEVPSNPFQASKVIEKIEAPWLAMLKAFDDADVKYEAHAAPITRGGNGTAPAASTTPRRTRKSRQTVEAPAAPDLLPAADNHPFDAGP